MYELTNKSGETITKRHAKSMSDAIRIFSIIKGLDKESLLKIYEVVYSG
jgi:hypothetical protein